MSQVINIKLTKIGPNTGPFDVFDQDNNLLVSDVPKFFFISGATYTVANTVTAIKLVSKGKCAITIQRDIEPITQYDYDNIVLEHVFTGCLWRHLTNIQLYNSFYGATEPYIIEYPFAYQYQDEIVQSVVDYTKSYKYLPIPDGVFNYNTKIEVDNQWFNKAILYNGQQSSGTLELVAKPINNLKEYLNFPKYNANSRVITYTKSDNFYQYNTFWASQVSSQNVLFNTSCKSLSYDKEINDSNIDYGVKSFNKAPLRAKELKVRHILDNKSDIHLVSQFIVTPSQISYK